MTHNFGEKATEYSVKQKQEIPVWQSDKYKATRKKAEELIENGKYDLSDSDFWILMNETKSGKMAYTGLIISHNACLKINDKLEAKDRFSPSSVTIDKDGYRGTLVCIYCNDEQGIFEVGEVSSENCKNAYPYAMAFKRLYDRVVLKASKIAFDGIYSEVEADEFREPIIEPPELKNKLPKMPDKAQEKPETIPEPKAYNPVKLICEMCQKEITSIVSEKTGEEVSAEEVVATGLKRKNNPHGWVLCAKCQKAL